MKYLKLLLLLVIFLGFDQVVCDDCIETGDTGVEVCEETEYTSYIECVRKRTKRHAGCSQNCDSCDCNYCSSGGCSSHCNVCCANFEQPCETKYCCYKTCHSQCSHQGCRDSCRRTCTDKLQDQKETVIHTRVGQAAQTPNITTIINLHNRINNTNIIDVPINLKTDNINNITINTSDYGSNATTTGGQSCCQVVSPRQCTPTKEFPFVRCFHLRKRVCGNICKANIMHAQPHQVCDQRDVGPPDCHNQVIYIPQPQPKCTYKAEWPYVACNIPAANCEGCYDHYVTNSPRPTHCSSSCYNEGGYGVGPINPYVRPYPAFRPNFAPAPNCLQLGTCSPYYGGGGLDYGFSSAGNSEAVPLSGIGYVPSAYENNYVVHLNPEMTDMSKLFTNFLHNDDYDAQTLPITNSITHPPPTLVEPRLVKVETVNATDVFMTIKELNDDGSLEDNDVTTLPSATVPQTSAAGTSPAYVPNVGTGLSSMGSDFGPVIRRSRHDQKSTTANTEAIDVMMADEGKSETTKATTASTKPPKLTKSSSPAKLAANAS